RHTADNILQQYENTMAHFDISNQISHIVTDSASNMLNAFSLPGFVDTDDQEPAEPEHTTDDDPSAPFEEVTDLVQREKTVSASLVIPGIQFAVTSQLGSVQATYHTKFLTSLRSSITSVPASSAPVDRLFSVAGTIFRPDMCSLKDTTFETLMFLRINTK
ncbi:hypothetical protein LSAT2_020187, partial [Lamellibrachia satsuma]